MASRYSWSSSVRSTAPRTMKATLLKCSWNRMRLSCFSTEMRASPLCHNADNNSHMLCNTVYLTSTPDLKRSLIYCSHYATLCIWLAHLKRSLIYCSHYATLCIWLAHLKCSLIYCSHYATLCIWLAHLKRSLIYCSHYAMLCIWPVHLKPSLITYCSCYATLYIWPTSAPWSASFIADEARLLRECAFTLYSFLHGYNVSSAAWAVVS